MIKDLQRSLIIYRFTSYHQMSESKLVKEIKPKEMNKKTKLTKKIVKVSEILQKVQIPDPETTKNKDEFMDVISQLRSLDSFIDFTDNTQTQKIMSMGTISLRTMSELSPIKKLLMNHVKSLKDISLSTKLIGTFIIFPNSHHFGTRVNVYVDQISMNEPIYHLQFADLPRYFWYPIKNSDDLNRFISMYTETYKGTCTNLPQQKRVRYDLKRNNNFHPIMLERYMVTNTFTDNFVWGPVANDENIVDVVSSMSSFDMATKYYDMMQQYEDIFVLCTVSRYSRSTVATQISVAGTITDICYTPDSTYREQIKQINAEIDSDFDEDLPIDIVLFLLPFAAVSQRYHTRCVETQEIDNKILIDDETISMVYRLNVGIMSHKDLIILMKKFYEKIKASTKSTTENQEVAKKKKNKKEKIEERDIQSEYMIDLIKNYVTREYIDMMIAETDAAKITHEKIKNKKVINAVLKNDKDKGDRKYKNTDKIEIADDVESSDDSDAGNASDDNEETHATEMMNSVINLMTDNEDKKFIDRHLLKRRFYKI